MITDVLTIDTIDMGDRLRQVDPDRVLMIMASAEKAGIRQPIEVRPAKAKGRFLLVTGGHRLTAAIELGHTTIPAIVLPKMTDDEARLLEIDENVYRAELSDLDRAVFLAEKKAIHERLYPQTKHGGDRKSEEARDQVAIFGDLIDRFTDEVRERLDLSERTLQRIIRRAKIAKDVRDRISGTPIARNGAELDALVKLDEDAQRAAVAMVLSDEEDAPKRITAAVLILKGKREAAGDETDDEAGFRSLLRAWKNSSSRERTRFIDHLVEAGDPHMTVALRALEEEAA